MESDAIYFRRRASEEYLAANYAGPSVAFRAHREMAARFADLAEAIEAEEQGLDARAGIAFELAAGPERELERATLWV